MINPRAPYVPRAIARIELTEAIPSLSFEDAGPSYVAASVLVTLHHRPLGMVELELIGGRLGADAVASGVWSALHAEITAHLAADGIPLLSALNSAGFVNDPSEANDPPCWPPALEPRPFVSIVIATKDRTDELERCLVRLLDQQYDPFEIVVVDNGATSHATKKMVARRFGTEARIRYEELAVASASHARNAGARAARGEMVAFTDDDVIVDPRWLDALVRPFADAEVDCVTGLVLPASFDHQAQQWFEEYGGFNKGYQAHTYDRSGGDRRTALYPYTAGTFGSGNNAAFRRTTLLANGGFDPALGPGTPTRAGEDLDAFLAVILRGRKIAYEPAAIISHFHRDDYPALERQLFNYGIGLTAIFTKWFLRSPAVAWEIVRRVPTGLRVIFDPKSTKNHKKSASFPAALGRAELKGMALGPLLYLWSARKHR